MTLDRLHQINNTPEQLEGLLNGLFDILELRSDYYKDKRVLQAEIDFRTKDGSMPGIKFNTTVNKVTDSKKPDLNLLAQTHKLFNYNLPLNVKYRSWGKVKYENGDLLIIEDKKLKSRVYHVNRHENHNSVQIKIKNKLILEFIDRKTNRTDNMVSEFIRSINSAEFFIADGKVVHKIIKFKPAILRTIKKEKKVIEKLLTLDIETRVVGDSHIPYCICIFDIKLNKKYSFYISDYADSNDLLANAIKSLLKPKYNGYVIYAHNLAKFDGIFLLSNLIKLSKNYLNKKEQIIIEPVLRDGNLIMIKLKFYKYNIIFKDSYLLLPLSLLNLSQSFGVTHPKTHFPHKFLNDKFNSEINLNYIGKVPGPEYFNNPDNYFEFLWNCINNNVRIDRWSLREESIRYCMNDCIALAEVIIKFNELFYSQFKINIHNYPTLPSLTFGLFRSNHLPKLEKEGIYIPLINGSMYDFLKLSYSGGTMDMIIPQPKIDPETGEKKKIYMNDVNSLYPASMGKGMLMPVVTKYDRYISFFIGDILQTQHKPFGFFDVDVETTRNLDIPVLQMRKKLENGTFTISPLGK